MSDHEKKSIVSVERCGKDPGIGASLHRLVHMDVLLTYWQFFRWGVFVYGGGYLDISLQRLVHMDVHSCEFTLVRLFLLHLFLLHLFVHLEICGGEVPRLTSFARLPNQTSFTF